MLLPPHTSHLTQPLDVAVFGPLKKAMAVELHGLIQTEVSRIQKVEWLAAYVQAHHRTFSAANIFSAWSGARLVPFSSAKVLRRIPASSSTPSPRATTPEMVTPFNNSLLVSSPIDITAFRIANLELTRLTSSQEPLSTPARKHIQRLTKAMECLFARNTILEQEKEALKEVVTARKKRLSGKRGAIKGKHVITAAEIYSQVCKAENATQQRKRSKTNLAIDPSLVPLPPRRESPEELSESENILHNCIVVAM